MSRFHSLTVTGIHRTIRDAVVLTLEAEDPAAFAFVPGQYLTFRKTLAGTELRRNYSICAGSDEGLLQVGIKRVEGGAFSSFANTDLKVGDRLEAMPPQGRFTPQIDPDSTRNFLGFAGGSGITPILSILKTVLTRAPGATFTLVYANRAVNTIMFREELEDLKNRYMGRLRVVHMLESGQDMELFTGRIDAAKCVALFRHWIDISAIDTALICGPEPMMLAIADSLRTHGLSDDRILFELFTESQKGRLARAAIAERATDQAATQVEITVEGVTRHFAMPKDQSVLEAALNNGLDAPFACKAGVCSTCKARVLEGDCEMLSNHALEDDEVARGMVLTCQCYPLSDRIVVEYDTH
ncbi:2Fe-2S iron-sulfur cluster-binding protein [uncultured Roseobacter sp.]|uniref:2Fe-2S iron-sulfur cluster-binding protein n=1 Tax=uncultured Roseobacter sp. TaxID=114847 RepID=UPI002621AB88|nr:2Fe-2S iron-sulfur cluster-binding protein [uncultured Roseobacter sp.]